MAFISLVKLPHLLYSQLWIDIAPVHLSCTSPPLPQPCPPFQGQNRDKKGPYYQAIMGPWWALKFQLNSLILWKEQ